MLNRLANHSVLLSALVMASVFGIFHGKVDLYPHLSLELPKPYTLSCERNYMFWEVCDVFLDNEVKDPDTYANLEDRLAKANWGDRIRVHLSGFGGQAMTLMQIVHAVKASRAHVVMILEGPTYSAHSYLAIAGDELIARPGSFLMFHMAQGGNPVSTNPPEQWLNWSLNEFLHYSLKGLVTQAELDYIFSAPYTNQLYITGDEMVKRFNKLKGL